MRSYQDILNKVRPLYQKYPERFIKFYNEIFLLLSDLKPGQELVVSACCTPRSTGLFLDIAEMIMYEEHFHGISGKLGELEFVEDKSIIRRLVPIRFRKMKKREENAE